MNLGTMYATLGVNTAGLVAANSAMTNFQKNTITSLNMMSQRLRTFGYLSLATLTLPIVMAGKASVKMASDYEASLSKVIGLVGVARSQVEAWGEDILKMAPKVGKGPKELADALYFITSAGIRGAEAMEVLEMSAKASAGGLGEVKAVADIVTSAMNAFGIENLSAARAVDVLTATVREGKSEATALASTMGMVLPIAAAMGVTFDQVGAAMASMTRTGTKAPTAAMQLRQILTSIQKIKPSSDAAKALDYMGTSADELRKTIKQGGLLQVLVDLERLSDEYGNTILGRVFPNIRALSGVLDILGKNFEENKKIFYSISRATGSANEAFKVASQTIKQRFNVQMAKAQVSVVKFGGTLATVMLPVFERLGNSFERVIAHFDALTDAQKRSRIKWLIFIAALGPAAMALSLLGYGISGLITLVAGLWKGLTLLTLVLKGVTGNVVAMDAAMVMNLRTTKMLRAVLTSPWTLVAGAIVVATVALVKYMKKMEEIPDRITKLKAGFRSSKEEEPYFKDMLSVTFAMDKPQLADLQNGLEQRLKILKDNRVKTIALQRNWFTDDAKYLNLQKTLQEDLNNLVKWQGKGDGLNARVTVKGYESDIVKDKKDIADYITSKTVGFGKDFDNVNTKIAGTEEALKKVATVLENFPVDPMLAEIEKQKKLRIETEAVAKVFQKLAEGELRISRSTKLMGKGFDVAKEKTSLYNTIIKELIGTTLPIADERFQQLARAVKLVNTEVEAIPIEKIKAAVGLLGHALAPGPGGKTPEEPFNFMSNKEAERNLNVLNQMNVTFGTFRTMVALANGQLINLQNTFNQLAASEEGTTAEFEDLKRQIEAAELVVLKLEAVKSAVSTIQNVFTNMFMTVGEGWKAMGDVIINSLKRIAAEIAAKAVLFGLLDIISGGGSGVVSTVAGGLIKGGFFKFLLGGVGMAQGGTVPPGFPNDSYPAALTSGERVLPVGAPIPSGLSSGNGLSSVLIKFENGSLQGYLEYEGRKQNSYM